VIVLTNALGVLTKFRFKLLLYFLAEELGRVCADSKKKTGEGRINWAASISLIPPSFILVKELWRVDWVVVKFRTFEIILYESVG
jgi:hypothetical protein